MKEEGKWITIRGRHVFLKEGQSISDAIAEYEKNRDKEKTKFYRGLTQKYDPNYDKSKLDNPNGYESWTDSKELAQEYAGKNGYVYSVEVPNKDINQEDIFNSDGDRSLMYYNNKPVALHGVEGEEFMLYTEHEDWNKLNYKLENDDTFKNYSVSREDKKSPYVVNYEVGKEKFDFPSNEYLDSYIQKGTDLPSRDDYESYKMVETIKEVKKLSQPSPESFMVYAGIRKSDELDKRKLISTSLQESTANIYAMKKGSDGITVPIKIEEGAKIISTFNSIDKGGVGDNVHFKNQGEIIIPVEGNKIIKNKNGSYTVKPDNYYGAKLEKDSDDNRIVKVGDKEIKMLDKKEYRIISKDFADSLNEKETKMIQSYVDAPGLSGELNDYDPYGETRKSGTRYLYNTTDENMFISHNELNKYYTDMREKYMKEVGTELNPHWPTDEQIKWAKKVLNTDSYSKAEDFLKEIDRRDSESSWVNKEDMYYTPKQIQEFKDTYDKVKPLYDEQLKYKWNDPEYEEIKSEIEKINKTGFGEYQLNNLRKLDEEQIFNSRDYDFNESLKEGKIEYIGAKEIKDLETYSPYQSTNLIETKNLISNKLNDFNKLFDEKGITLDHDVIVFRRGRESSKQLENGFTMDGLISTCAYDSLPKKMPSGNWFGDRRYYIILPSGTKVLLSEQVIGRGYEDQPEYDSVWRGVKKQHEILLRPGTHFNKISTSINSKGEDDILLIAEEENK